MCDALSASGVGVAIDVYHVWWDPELAAQIARAARRPHLAHHICDWLVPTRDLLLDRGMMGDGVIDLRRHPRGDRGGRLSRPAGGRDLLGRELVEAPRRRGARHLRRALRERLLSPAIRRRAYQFRRAAERFAG